MRKALSLKHHQFRGAAERSHALRKALAAVIVALLCLAFVPIAAQVSVAATQPASAQVLGTPAASQGDGVHHLGFQRSPQGNYATTPTSPLLLSSAPLGATADVSSQLPPIGNQGAQGSCVAWATSYYYKTWVEKQEHTSWSLSDTKHQFSPSFIYNQINGGHDNGSNFQDAFAILQNKGDVDISEFPYNQNNYTNQPSAMQFQEAKPYRIPAGWTSFWNKNNDGPFNPPNDITNAKAWLASGKPLVMGLPVFNDWPDYGSNPAKTYYDYNGSSSLAGGHGVAIVGYNDNINPGGADADHKGGFKMVNSWGPSWNGNGFVYLSYDFVKRYVWEAWTMGDNAPDSPSVSSLSKASGNVGDSVDVNGANFGGLRRSAKVTFNGTAATQLTWTSEKVTMTVPAGATSGPVVVSDWEGTASNGVQFTVGTQPSGPTVSSVNPSTVENAGTVSIAAGGQGFAAGAGIRLVRTGYSDIVATGVSFTNSTQISGNVDLTGAAPGAWDVAVRNPNGLTGVLSGGFTVTAPPGSNGDTYEPNDDVATAYGPLDAGATYSSFIWTDTDVDYYQVAVPAGVGSVTANLAGIPSGCDYDLYAYDASGNEVSYSTNGSNIDEQIVLSAPAAGTYYLMVESYQNSSQTEAYQLSYTRALVPSVTSMSPATGARSTAVTLTGSSFGATRGTSNVALGSAALAPADYVSWSSSRIVFRIPTAVGGKPVVTVTTAAGKSNGFALSILPMISTISTTSGRAGTPVTINGINFGTWVGGQTVVYFGSARAISYVSWTNGQMRLRVPVMAKGVVQLKVKTAGGLSQAKSFRVY